MFLREILACNALSWRESPIALMNFGMRFLKCVSQVRELFRYTPRYLTLVFIFCPLGNRANKAIIHYIAMYTILWMIQIYSNKFSKKNKHVVNHDLKHLC